MLVETACVLLLLRYGRLAVALAMSAFPRRTLLALVAVSLLVALQAAHNTRCCLRDGSALLANEKPRYSRLSRVRQQHFPLAWFLDEKPA